MGFASLTCRGRDGISCLDSSTMSTVGSDSHTDRQSVRGFGAVDDERGTEPAGVESRDMGDEPGVEQVTGSRHGHRERRVCRRRSRGRQEPECWSLANARDDASGASS